MSFWIQSIFERFTSPATMIDAEQELLALGAGAVPILERFFSGEAKDDAGMPWRVRDLPLRCAIEVASRLGPVAKPLEPWLRAEVTPDSYWAASALGRLQTLEEASVAVLASALTMAHNHYMRAEAAAALIRCGQGDHPLVKAALASSANAAATFASMKTLLEEGTVTRTPEEEEALHIQGLTGIAIATLCAEHDAERRAWAVDQLLDLDAGHLHLLLRSSLGTDYWAIAAQMLRRIGYPRVRGIIPDLLEWLQDMNWPGAQDIFGLLLSVDDDTLLANLKLALIKAKDENDEVWIWYLRTLVRAKHLEHALSGPEWDTVWALADRYEDG